MNPALLVCTLTLAAVYLLALRTTNRDPLSPMFLHALFLMLGIVLPAAYQYAVGGSIDAGTFSFRISANIMWVLCIALAFFIIGACLASALFGKVETANSVPYENLSSPNAMGRVRVLLGIAAATTVFFFIVHRQLYLDLWQALGAGDVFTLIQTTRIEALYGSTWAIQGITRIAPIVSMLLLSRWYITRDRLAKKLAISILGVTFICLTVIGIRGIQIETLFQLALLHGYFRRVNKRRIVFALLSIAGVLVGLTALKFGFGADNGTVKDGAELISRTAQRVAIAPNHLQFALDNFPDRFDFRYGGTYLQDAISLIPSPIKHRLFSLEYWEDFNGFVYRQLYGDAGGTATVTVMGEFYANFGLAGVAVGCALYSFILQALSLKWMRRDFSTSVGVVLATTISFAMALSTIEGLGEQLFVSLLWAAIISTVTLYGIPATSSTSPFQVMDRQAREQLA